MILAMLFWVACSIIGYVIGDRRGYAITGFVLGLLLGPIGLLIIWASSGDLMPCRFCRENVKLGATVCRWCGRDNPVAPRGRP